MSIAGRSGFKKKSQKEKDKTAKPPAPEGERDGRREGGAGKGAQEDLRCQDAGLGGMWET